jgi:hypothetical protein
VTRERDKRERMKERGEGKEGETPRDQRETKKRGKREERENIEGEEKEGRGKGGEEYICQGHAPPMTSFPPTKPRLLKAAPPPRRPISYDSTNRPFQAMPPTTSLPPIRPRLLKAPPPPNRVTVWRKPTDLWGTPDPIKTTNCLYHNLRFSPKVNSTQY